MSQNNSIDGKPRLRGYSARGRRKALESNNTPGVAMADVHQHDDLEDTDSNDLNVRVKDRGDGDGVQKKGRMGSLFKEVPAAGIKSLLNKEGASGVASELKETIKRPLSGLFRRPGSKAGGRPKDEDNSGAVTAVDDRTLSPEVPRRPSMSAAPPRGARGVPSGMSGQSEWESIANAPHLTVNQLHGMLQIDAFATKYPQLAKLDDLDISLLSRFLCHEEEVKDEDVPWTWDYVFASISTEMREEWALDHEDGGDN